VMRPNRERFETSPDKVTGSKQGERKTPGSFKKPRRAGRLGEGSQASQIDFGRGKPLFPFRAQELNRAFDERESVVPGFLKRVLVGWRIYHDALLAYPVRTEKIGP